LGLFLRVFGAKLALKNQQPKVRKKGQRNPMSAYQQKLSFPAFASKLVILGL